MKLIQRLKVALANLRRARANQGKAAAYPLPARPTVNIPHYRIAPRNGRYEVLCERDL